MNPCTAYEQHSDAEARTRSKSRWTQLSPCLCGTMGARIPYLRFREGTRLQSTGTHSRGFNRVSIWPHLCDLSVRFSGHRTGSSRGISLGTSAPLPCMRLKQSHRHTDRAVSSHRILKAFQDSPEVRKQNELGESDLCYKIRIVSINLQTNFRNSPTLLSSDKMTEIYTLPHVGPASPLLLGSSSEKIETKICARSGLNLEVRDIEFAVKVKKARKVLVDKVCLKAQGGRITGEYYSQAL